MSNSTILDEFLSQAKALSVTLNIPGIWPGLPKKPPSQGMWLEVKHFPNEPGDLTWDNTSQTYVMGFFQISLFYRPGTNTGQNSQLAASVVADQIIAHFAKGRPIDEVRVLKTPWQSPAIDLKDKSFVPITVSYRGIVQVAGYSESEFNVTNLGANVTNGGEQVTYTP